MAALDRPDVAPLVRTLARPVGGCDRAHILGGAMAALMAVMLMTETAYAPIAERLRPVYTPTASR